jgi:subtilisin family serine protease
VAVDLMARVINMSFGTPASAIAPGEPLPHTDVVRYALDSGCVLVAASGNSGIEERYTPACLDGVIAVGACDDRGTACSFSTRGTHVQLAAPGESIMTAGLDVDRPATGTSFAAPFVAGAGALLVSLALRRSALLTPERAASVLRQSARAWRGTPPRGSGVGILDARAALEILDRDITHAGALDEEAG